MLRRTIASGRSCLECSRRKIKCDRSLPCSYCVKIKAACVYPPTRRRSRSPDSGNVSVTSRLDKIEDTLRVLSEDIGQIRDSLCHLVSITTADTAGDGEILQTRPSNPHGNCDDTGPGSENGTELPICANRTLDSAKKSTERQHPSPVTISILWHWYLDTADPVLRVYHTPSVQKDIMQIITEGTIVDVAKQCLIFAICYASIISMSSATCLDKLNEDRSTLLKR